MPRKAKLIRREDGTTTTIAALAAESGLGLSTLQARAAKNPDATAEQLLGTPAPAASEPEPAPEPKPAPTTSTSRMGWPRPRRSGTPPSKPALRPATVLPTDPVSAGSLRSTARPRWEVCSVWRMLRAVEIDPDADRYLTEEDRAAALEAAGIRYWPETSSCRDATGEYLRCASVIWEAFRDRRITDLLTEAWRDPLRRRSDRDEVAEEIRLWWWTDPHLWELRDQLFSSPLIESKQFWFSQCRPVPLGVRVRDLVFAYYEENSNIWLQPIPGPEEFAAVLVTEAAWAQAFNGGSLLAPPTAEEIRAAGTAPPVAAGSPVVAFVKAPPAATPAPAPAAAPPPRPDRRRSVFGRSRDLG